MHAIFLLIGRFVLLIDDDQAKIGIGKKQRGARTGDDFRLAGRQSCKSPLAFPSGDA